MDYNICELIHTATWRGNAFRWIISAENRLFVIIVIDYSHEYTTDLIHRILCFTLEQAPVNRL